MYTNDNTTVTFIWFFTHKFTYIFWYKICPYQSSFTQSIYSSGTIKYARIPCGSIFSFRRFFWQFLKWEHWRRKHWCHKCSALQIPGSSSELDCIPNRTHKKVWRMYQTHSRMLTQVASRIEIITFLRSTVWIWLNATNTMVEWIYFKK